MRYYCMLFIIYILLASSVYELMALALISKAIIEKVLSARLLLIVNKHYSIMKIVSPNATLVDNI